MDNNTIREILKTKSMLFTKAEIEAMMDEELEKDVDEMNTELIELCLNALNSSENKSGGDISEESVSDTPSATPIRKNKFIKILIVAAILLSFMAVSFLAGADLLNIDVSDGSVQEKDGHLEINLNGESTETKDLKVLLSENNLEDLVLPQYLYDECEISGFEIDEGDDVNKRVSFDFFDVDANINGSFCCYVYQENANFFSEKDLVPKNVYNLQKLFFNNIEVLIFSLDNLSHMAYTHKNIEYELNIFSTDYNFMVKIAETI